MKLSLTLATFLCLFLPYAAAADLGTISGVVRDDGGKPIAGVHIKITSQESTNTDLQTATGSAGDYRFNGLAYGTYTVTVESAGFAPAAPVTTRLSSTANPVKLDFVLRHEQASPDVSSTSPSRPVLQASGIHGLIDPGGYSASATSNAASGILQGMADVQGNDPRHELSEVSGWPCSREPELQRALSEHPDDAQANLLLGQFYVAHHQPQKAIPLLRRALQSNEDGNAASESLAEALMQDGQPAQAAVLLTTLSRNHNEPEIHERLARALEASGKFQEASQQYRDAARQKPNEKDLYAAGYELILAGSPDAALRVFEDSEQQFPQSMSLRIGVGTAQFFVGQASESIHTFLDAADADPSDPRPYPLLASVSDVSNAEASRVRSAFERYLQREPGRAAASYFLALTLSREAGNPDANRIDALLRQAILQDPGLAEAHHLLANFYFDRGSYAQAATEYEATLRLDPDLAGVHYRLALAYRRSGRGADAELQMRIFQQSKDKKPTSSGEEKNPATRLVSALDKPAPQVNTESDCSAAPNAQQ